MLNRFTSLSLADLKNFITDAQEENLHLDFKLVKDAGIKSSDDKHNFGRALSGFANSSGGLIVWGVDARKNEQGVDCAMALQPIDKVHLLVSRLNSLTGEAVDPTVAGVQHRAVEKSPNVGFVISLIPESDTGPHMAKLGDDRFYKRVGDSFYRMEHYDVADMFGRRRRPKLELFYRVIGTGSNAEVHLGLRNSGRATARAPYFAFACTPPLARSSYGLDGNMTEGLKFLRFASTDFPWKYGGGMDFAIHPHMGHEVACINLGIPARPAPTADCQIRFAIACEDQPIETGTLIVPVTELCP
jgi:hypothetical protein